MRKLVGLTIYSYSLGAMVTLLVAGQTCASVESQFVTFCKHSNFQLGLTCQQEKDNVAPVTMAGVINASTSRSPLIFFNHLCPACESTQRKKAEFLATGIRGPPPLFS